MPTTALLSISVMIMALYLWWGIRHLPAERWQILAAVPVARMSGGRWKGVNLTWYGVLTANSYIVAVVTLLFLMGSVGVPPLVTSLLAATMLILCVPASRIVARMVEKKAHTFTVGGAVFVGILVTAPVILMINHFAGKYLAVQIPLMPAYGAIATAYAFGEGLGRLACISFGCCYGKPLTSASPLIRRIFMGRGFVFHGSTRKVAYAGGLEGAEVIPIQAVTAVLYTACGVICSWLFLTSNFTASFLVATIFTQGWRSFSETMRADYRGESRISAYQVMSMSGVAYAVGVASLLAEPLLVPPDVAAGIANLWDPAVVLFLQGIWMAIFLYTGCSSVTGATLAFHLHEERV